ncbi:MAG: DUF481 domain-containing protein [Gammaproteobacteria bacterium]|nr:DUF481 domain-containing protein [Gammaproteobacteria bacterium]
MRPLMAHIAAALLIASASALAGSKTDVIHLRNGDRITGEFKEFTQGELELSTAELGTVRIKWNAIVRIESDKWLQIELSDGTRFFGTLPANANGMDRIISVQTLKQDRLPVSMDTVVRAEQIRPDESFWEQLDGYGKFGINYTKASDVLSNNISLGASLRTFNYLSSLTFDSVLTRKGDGVDTRRANLTGSYIWFRPERWFWAGGLAAEQNEELGIDLRLTGSGGVGRFLRQSQRSEIYLVGGLAVTQEFTRSDAAGNSNDGSNLEALVNFNWTFFKLYSPKSRVNFRAILRPGITDTSRWRSNIGLNMRQELYFDDLFLDLDIYYDYDSKPPPGANAKDDYGLVTSLGYEF